MSDNVKKNALKRRLRRGTLVTAVVLMVAATVGGVFALGAYDTDTEHAGASVLMKDGSTNYFYRGSDKVPVSYWEYNNSTQMHDEFHKNDIKMTQIPYSGNTTQQSITSFVNNSDGTENRGFCISAKTYLYYSADKFPGYHYIEVDFDELSTLTGNAINVDKIRFIVNDINNSFGKNDATALAVAQAAIWYWTGEKTNGSDRLELDVTAKYHCLDGIRWPSSQTDLPDSEKHTMNLNQPVYGRDDVESYLALYDLYTTGNEGLTEEEAFSYLDNLDITIAKDTGFTATRQKDGSLLLGPYKVGGENITSENITLSHDADTGAGVSILDSSKEPLSGTVSVGDSVYLLIGNPAVVNTVKLSASFTAQRSFTDVYALATVEDGESKVTAESWKKSQAIMGTFEYTAEKTQTASIDADLYKVVLTKFNKDEQRLQGADFKLQYKVGGEYVDYDGVTYKTNSGGEISVSGLPEGEYRFVETRAPSGYQLPANRNTEFELPDYGVYEETIDGEATGVLIYDGLQVINDKTSVIPWIPGGDDDDDDDDVTPSPSATPEGDDDDDDDDVSPVPSTTPAGGDDDDDDNVTPTPVPTVTPPEERPMVENDDGSFTVFDDDGTPLGTWRQDPETGEWFFDDEIPLGEMAPETGDSGLQLAAFIGMLASFIAAAALLLGITKRDSRRQR